MITPPARTDLVLLGGGHSHVLALRMLAMAPVAGLRITLVSQAPDTPYSGMLPGLVAGHYDLAQTHIDLQRLCGRLGVRFVCATARGLEPLAQQLNLEGRPDLAYDLLSIDIGSQPDFGEVAGAAEFATPVKPVASFYHRWQQIERRLASATTEPLRIVVVGGGAGSVELALAMRHRFADSAATIHLVCGGELLEAYNRGAQARVRERCRAMGVEILEQSRVLEVRENCLQLVNAGQLAFNELFWCTSAVGAKWLQNTGLPLEERGFLQVADTLQVQGQDNIFAAGDVATQVSDPRPKAGVYAVRQAPVLAHNLAAMLRGESLKPFRPQRLFLSLLSLGGKEAVADRGMFSASGAWVWRWKDAIDRRFMNRFTQLPITMPTAPESGEPLMYCGGCGAKLPSDMLRRSLSRLAARFPDVVRPENFQDDAVQLQFSSEATVVQTIDVLRGLLDDPWLMGRVAALHALSDIHAMGATPHSALASLTLPHAAPALQERDLDQLMAGAVCELQRVGCQLAGGHTTEGVELSIGFAVNGELPGGTALGKRGMAAGDQLVLCKPLGTGVLFAAQMYGRAEGNWMQQAQAMMLQSNASAAVVARNFDASACTDITGFGLAGHLQEMLRDSPLEVELQLASLPLLPGVESCFLDGQESTLQAANRASVASLQSSQIGADDPRLKVLFDPQTCGGLLLSIPAERTDAAVRALVDAGYPQAVIIGCAGTPESASQPGTIRIT